MTQDTKPSVPPWFVAAVAYLHELYPGAQIGVATAATWWRFMGHLRQDAIRAGFRRAIDAHPDRIPTAPQIRAAAEAANKTSPVPNLDLPALPEPEPTLPRTSEWYDKLEAYKRGEIPRSREEIAEHLGSLTGAKP